MEAVTLIRDTQPVGDIVAGAVDIIKNGEIDPLVAFCNITRMERAIKAIKADDDVRDITLRELAKYGKSQRFGDMLLEEAESGVVYDYSECGDDELAALYADRRTLDAAIKAREALLRALPASGMADATTGAVLYPPARTSRTIIKITLIK